MEPERDTVHKLTEAPLREAQSEASAGATLIRPADPGDQSLTACLRSSGVGAYSWTRARDLVVWQGYPHPAMGLSGIQQNPLSVFVSSLHPEDVEDVLATVDRAIDERERWEMRYRVIWPDGSLHWILDRGEPTFGTAGAIEGFSGVCFEVTQQVETEQELARQRTFLRMVLDLNPGMIFAKDSAGRFTLANPALAEFYGTRAEDMIGKTDADLGIDAELVERFRAQNQRILEHRETMWRYEEPIRDVRGKPHWVEKTKLPLLEEDGRCEQVMGVAIDTTARKESELALAQQRAFLRQVIDSSPSLIFAKDREGRFTLANQAVADLYGTAPTEMVGKTDSHFHRNRAEIDAYRANDAAVFERAERVLTEEEMYTAPDGEARWFHTVKVPLLDDARQVSQILGVATEITEQKRAQAERERLEESLRQSQKMESIGHLAAGIAHDFNNLLTPILGYAELATQALPDGHPIRDDLSAVTQAAESASALVQQLLAFGRKQRLEMRELVLNPELEAIVDILKRVIPEHIRIDLDLDPGVEAVRADPIQLQQILLNLAVNARDAMPSGGDLVIRSVRAPAADATPGVAIAVTDTGCGMGEAVMKRVFEPFYTTKERGSRVGLGLSTVYGIVEQHGGSIAIDSEPGLGTTFSIWFPTCAGGVVAEPLAPAPQRRGALRGRVLVVEDDPGVREFVCRVLRDDGFEVGEAQSGDLALEIATKSGTPFDLLLTDLIMPGTSGGVLFDQIASRCPDTRVLYMSGYAEDALGTGEGTVSPQRLLHKPFSAHTLIERVDAALR